jgi:hypothetical protein
MSRFAKHYEKQQGEHGTWVVEESGLCLDTDAAAVEAGCTRRYQLVPLPNASGAIMKVLDGTAPAIVSVVPSTYSLGYLCVKVHGEVQPFTAVQEEGPMLGSAVLSYLIRYQQVGGVS